MSANKLAQHTLSYQTIHRNFMKWKEIKKERPPHGELIWVWDMERNCKFLIRYMGSENVWFETKEDTKFPIWASLNEPS